MSEQSQITQFQHSVPVPRLYKEAAKILKEVSKGGSVNTLLYNNKRAKNIKGLSALVWKASQHRSFIDRLLSLTNILVLEQRLDEHLARILIAELVFGKQTLGGRSKPVLTLNKYRQTILDSVAKADKYKIIGLRAIGVQKPRYVRVNTLKASVNDVTKSFKDECWTELECPDNYKDFLLLLVKRLLFEKGATVFVRDFHVKDMLVFPKDTNLSQHPAYIQGKIILQDKASCMFSCCIQPPPGSVLLDMCAAPGMKTSLLAALIQNQGLIYAVELSHSRCSQMQSMLDKFGVKCAKVMNTDAGTLGPETCRNVDYILVDPSCSGSGMTSRKKIEDIETRLNLQDVDENFAPHPYNTMMTSFSTNHKSQERLRTLANLQCYLLRHALSNFAHARCVIYSTCSLQRQENECVVEEALTCAELNGYELVDLRMRVRDWRNFGGDEIGSGIAGGVGGKCIYTRSETDFTNGGFLAVFERRKEWKAAGTEEGEREEEEEEEEEEEVVELSDAEEEKVELSEQFFVRINTLKISIDDAIQCFVDNGWGHLPSPCNYQIFMSGFRNDEEKARQRFFEQDFHIKELLIFPMGLKNSVTETFIKHNKFILQDKASCLAVHLLDPHPGAVVLNISVDDRTASFVANRLGNRGRIFVYERLPRVAKKLTASLKAEGVKCARVICDSGMNSNDFNCPGVGLVLVCPPSSGSGIRNKSRSHFRDKATFLKHFTSRQFSLLHHALASFPQAKRIVYSTKSIHPEENEEIVNATLVFAKFQGYRLVDSVSRVEGWVNSRKPKYHCGEKCLIAQRDTGITKGFFIAVFEKDEGLKVSQELSENLKTSAKQGKRKMDWQKAKLAVKVKDEMVAEEKLSSKKSGDEGMLSSPLTESSLVMDGVKATSMSELESYSEESGDEEMVKSLPSPKEGLGEGMPKFLVDPSPKEGLGEGMPKFLVDPSPKKGLGKRMPTFLVEPSPKEGLSKGMPTFLVEPSPKEGLSKGMPTFLVEPSPKVGLGRGMSKSFVEPSPKDGLGRGISKSLVESSIVKPDDGCLVKRTANVGEFEVKLEKGVYQHLVTTSSHWSSSKTSAASWQEGPDNCSMPDCSGVEMKMEKCLTSDGVEGVGRTNSKKRNKMVAVSLGVAENEVEEAKRGQGIIIDSSSVSTFDDVSPKLRKKRRKNSAALEENIAADESRELRIGGGNVELLVEEKGEDDGETSRTKRRSNKKNKSSNIEGSLGIGIYAEEQTEEMSPKKKEKKKKSKMPVSEEERLQDIPMDVCQLQPESIGDDSCINDPKKKNNKKKRNSSSNVHDEVAANIHRPGVNVPSSKRIGKVNEKIVSSLDGEKVSGSKLSPHHSGDHKKSVQVKEKGKQVFVEAVPGKKSVEDGDADEILNLQNVYSSLFSSSMSRLFGAGEAENEGSEDESIGGSQSKNVKKSRKCHSEQVSGEGDASRSYSQNTVEGYGHVGESLLEDNSLTKKGDTCLKKKKKKHKCKDVGIETSLVVENLDQVDGGVDALQKRKNKKKKSC